MKVKRIVSMLMALCLCACCIGCQKEEELATPGYDLEFNVMANEVDDSSDLPDWEGKKLNLSVWYASGGAWRASNITTDDVVSKEIARVTGVTIDADNSFENTTGGGLQDAELAKMAATNQWPDLIIGPEAATVQKLVDGGVLFDLTEPMKKYCTNINNVYSSVDQLKPYLKSEREDGKMYQMPYSPTALSLKYTNPDIDLQKLNKVVSLTDRYPFVYVRDDVLKKVYPNAKTQKELEEIYMKNGKFTFEDITDVTFSSKEEFFDFLYKVRDMNLMENGRKIEAFYNASSSDNWGLLTIFGGLNGYNIDGNVGANYFTYWDKETGRVEYMYEQPFFKEAMWELTKLVIDDVSAKEALVDQRSIFSEMVTNGLYAVLYGTDSPLGYDYNDKSFGYRKVYLTIPQNTDKFLFTEPALTAGSIAVVNKNLKEEDLTQVMRYIDFFASKAGQKLVYWGPRSAGLYTEENGVLKYTDKELEDDMLYAAENKKRTYYGIDGRGWPQYPIYAPNIYNPKLITEMKRDKSETYGAFSYKHFEPLPEMKQSYTPDIWLFDSAGIKGVQDFWKSRTAFDEQILKIFVSKDRAEFDKNYQELIDSSRRLGMTEETLKEINEYFAEYNAEYMKNIK